MQWGKSLLDIVNNFSLYFISTLTFGMWLVILGWHWPTLRKGQTRFLMLLYAKTLKMFIFPELLNKVEIILFTRSQIDSGYRWVPKVKPTCDLSSKVAHFWLPHTYLNIFSQKPRDWFKSNFISRLLQFGERFYGRTTKMIATPLKIFARTKRPEAFGLVK